MPIKEDPAPPFLANSRQDGLATHTLYNGSKFQGFQKSQGKSYDVEVILQVCDLCTISLLYLVIMIRFALLCVKSSQNVSYPECFS